jgi:hypothetical protein
VEGNSIFRKNRILLFAVLMVTPCVSHSTGLGGDVVTTSVQVDSVKIVLLQSFPIRAQIVVHGQKIKAVDLDVTQERQGREATVTITQTYSQEIEPHMSPFKEHVFLQGGFTPGTYILRVNDYLTTFDIM